MPQSRRFTFTGSVQPHRTEKARVGKRESDLPKGSGLINDEARIPARGSNDLFNQPPLQQIWPVPKDAAPGQSGHRELNTTSSYLSEMIETDPHS